MFPATCAVVRGPGRSELETGKRRVVRELRPSDSATVIGIDRIALTADGRTYAYSAIHSLASDLYVIDGLR